MHNKPFRTPYAPGLAAAENRFRKPIVLCRKPLLLTLAALSFLTGCRESSPQPDDDFSPPATHLEFSASQASNALLRVAAFITECTPRDAGTPQGMKAAEWLHAALILEGIEARIDRFEDETPKGQRTFANVIGEIRGTGDEWIVLLSHFDTKAGVGPGFQGANDSGSSTGLLLELAAAIKKADARRLNFLFGFMDGEESLLAYSDRDGLHGSKRLARQLKNKETKIRAVILLDMIGDRDLKLTIPRNSTGELKLLAFKAAEALGHRDKVGLYRGDILDDHQPFLDLGYPAVNLIDFHFGSKPGANDYWHTMEDSMDKLSAESLRIIGGITLEMINRLQTRNAPLR
jgi:glutaminyl-peptide cyclotransferase